MTRLLPLEQGRIGELDALILVTEEAVPKKRVGFEALASQPGSLGDYTGSIGETVVVYTGGRPPRLILSGARGQWPPSKLARLVEGVAAGVRAARKLSASKVGVRLDDGVAEGVEVEGWRLYAHLLVAADMANYVYARRSRRKARILEEVAVEGADRDAVRYAEALAEAIRIARDFANAPPSEMNPDGVEEYARKLAEKYGLKLRVFHEDELEKLGMGGILAVGRGGGSRPRLIILEYDGGGGASAAIVGKTVTFDSGGLNLKSREGMLDMKYDKSGGGVALGVIAAAARLGLPLRLYALLPAVENMPDGRSYKPRDIIRMYNGVTVEITNTDAEGRLTLADALAYAARELNPDILIDVATLTGAAVIALGNNAAALFSNRDTLASEYEKLSMLIGEPAWRMPLWPVYSRQIETGPADLVNSGGRNASLVTAAKFLENFVEGKPWLHLDVAGVAWVQEKGPYSQLYEEGATGWGVRSLTALLEEMAEGRLKP